MKKATKIQIICIVVLLIVLWLFTSCKSKTVYVPVETVKTEYKDKYIRDSIFQKELVRIYQRGDTVFKDSIVYKYKDKLKSDSIFIHDSINVPLPYPVKGDTVYTNKLNWYQEACIWFTSLVLVALALYLGIKYRGVIFSFFRKLIFKI